ncbi:hypothetical protein OV090_23455 [Nannocystis sp. RBIL2]|uniref:hypothetical protein n=1 Tax=Nannocystis sp. RBIL2 TaxID=2996788 RepID=UPI0022719B6C|nr:hypothetical protein [Nannocystis sp. RBIL2]MCY1067725.1 hypothetical protein [Nannocystis sp. RBIL2]
MLRSRSFVATVLAVAMVPVPGLAAPAAPAAPAPPAGPAAPAAEPANPSEPPPGEPPSEVPTSDAPPDEVPVEEPAAEEPKTEEPPPSETPETIVPEGPERPPEPTLGNGKFKAKGTGLMISGGVLLGAGLVGVITSYFLTRCPESEIENSFACKNRQHNTFAVPATGAAALLGAVLLIVGLTYRARYKRWENWDPNRAKTAFRPNFTANGVSFKF